MSKNKSFTPEYKREIVCLVTEKGKKVNELAAEIDVSQTSIYRWKKQYSEHGEHAFPGKGNLLSKSTARNFVWGKMGQVLRISRSAYYRWLRKLKMKERRKIKSY